MPLDGVISVRMLSIGIFVECKSKYLQLVIELITLNSGDCIGDERDSYMWWDELHPSEQTGRNLAKEMLKKINGQSIY